MGAVLACSDYGFFGGEVQAPEGGSLDLGTPGVVLVGDTALLDTAGDCVDADADGYEDEACGGDDCDDGDAEVHPGAGELCDLKDNDCGGSLGADEIDADGDGSGDLRGGLRRRGTVAQRARRRRGRSDQLRR